MTKSFGDMHIGLQHKRDNKSIVNEELEVLMMSMFEFGLNFLSWDFLSTYFNISCGGFGPGVNSFISLFTSVSSNLRDVYRSEANNVIIGMSGFLNVCGCEHV